MGWDDVVTLTQGPLGYALAIILGGFVSYLITRWSMSRTSRETVINAAEGIKGTADRILGIDRKVSEAIELIDRLEHRSPEVRREAIQLDHFLGENAQLAARLQHQSAEKIGMCRYVVQVAAGTNRFVLDCGTSVALVWNQIQRSYGMNGAVLTNNIFVASSTSPDTGYDSEADIWGVKEQPSNCHVIGGTYFPSYGAILDLAEDSGTEYANILNDYRGDVILMGCTSFDFRTGPFARSGANSRFKESLMKYVLENESVQLIILVTPQKIGKAVGNAVSEEIWSKLRERLTVHVVCGFGDLDELSSETRAQLQDEIDKYQELKCQAKFVATHDDRVMEPGKLLS